MLSMMNPDNLNK